MNEQYLQNEIQQLQQARTVSVMESIMVMVFAFLNAAMLPQILYQYLIAEGSIDPNSPIFEHFTLIVYAVALLAVVWTAVANFMRARRVRQLQSDLELLHYVGPSTVVENVETSEALALALETAAAEKPARKTRKAASTAKATRSTSTRKTARSSRAKTK
jgi:hypothetical protein